MASQSANGVLGQEFTSHVIQAMGPNTTPRMRTVLSALIQHLHDFAREIDLTSEEWLAGVEMINWAGKMSTHKRNEGQLMCDVIGLESVVDDITYRQASKSDKPPTSSAILGPFWRADAPIRENGSSMTFNTPKDGVVTYMHGQVTDAETGKPLANASVDIWQASTNGLYEQQDDNQVEHNLRGIFKTDAEGRYSLYCLRPTPYPVPSDGPAGKLLKLMDRHEYRPAHIHLIVQAEGHRSLTTQIFDKDSKYLEDDSVFAVKDGLLVEFKPRKGDPQAEWVLEYNVKLGKKN
ncbi:aromatic compound dioxygenase [Trichoderma velutinum]